MQEETQLYEEVKDNLEQSDSNDRDSLEEFVTKEAEITDEDATKLLEAKANVYIDIDGKWKLELDDNGLEDETDDTAENCNIEDVKKEKDTFTFKKGEVSEEDAEEEKFEAKWCTPVSVRSDDSSSEDEKGPCLVPPGQGLDHKFSDGITWETIEEGNEEETDTEPDQKAVMNAVSEIHEKDAKKQELVNVALSSRPQSMHPTPGSGHTASVQEMGLEEVEEEEGGEGKEDQPEQLPELEGLPLAQSVVRNLELPHRSFTEDSMKPDEYEIMRQEIASICVRSLASFWEDLSKQVGGGGGQQSESPTIKKKWNSMPELKGQYAKRKLPDAPTLQKIRRLEDNHLDKEVVKSDFIVDDVDLCRSVSIKDRREMFENLDKKSKRDKKKQWSSMPSLKQEPRAPSPEKQKVTWQDEVPDWPEEIRPKPRARSPIKETTRSTLDRPMNLLPPQPSLVTTNAVQSPGPEELYSSSDSVCSSATSSSTVIPSTLAAQKLPSLLEDSAGEIYTGPQGKADKLFVVANGAEVPLTPLQVRKTVFESSKLQPRRMQTPGRRNGEEARSWEAGHAGEGLGMRFRNGNLSLPADLVKSSKLSYLEEEKEILRNINIVKHAKKRFLDA